ncbi:MAG: PIN domain-containing protein [Gemmatimonadetes bacterium]|nr:PIN domain-containing protein [Gemmatimonadota bacterium]
MLDTSVLIAAERRTLTLGALLESVADEPVGISALTASELLHGCHRAVDPDTQARRFAFVEALLDRIPVFEFGMAEARRHADLWAGLARSGSLIGAHDLVIGATALARGHVLATLNQRDFRRVPGLRLLAVEPFVTR